MSIKAGIRVDMQKLELIAQSYGIGTREELARCLGVSRGALYKARETGRVGGAFVARTLTKLPVKFDGVFMVMVEEPDYSAIGKTVLA